MNNEYNTDYYDVQYPGLILKLVMIRKLNYHVVQTYIPSTIYLTVSWLALFIPPQSVAERLAMSMTIMVRQTKHGHLKYHTMQTNWNSSSH